MKNEFIPIPLTHIPSFEELQEAEFRKNVKRGTDKMLQEFSFSEHKYIERDTEKKGKEVSNILFT